MSAELVSFTVPAPHRNVHITVVYSEQETVMHDRARIDACASKE